MKIYRNGVEIELTAEEIRQAHDEYTKYCKVEDVVDKIYEMYGFNLDRNEDKKLLNSIAERSEDILSKNDGYYEHFWDSVDAAINEYTESIILAQKPLTPSEFLIVATGNKYPEFNDLDEMLDALDSHGFEMWDYPVDEIDEALGNTGYVIVVEFPDGSKRIFEADDEMMEKYETVISEREEKKPFSLEDRISAASKKSMDATSKGYDRDNINERESIPYEH